MKRLETIRSQMKIKTALMNSACEHLESLKDFRNADDLRCRLQSDVDTYQADITALENERRDIIRSLEGLPEKQRLVLLLHYDGGLTWQEVARSLGVSLRYVYVLRGKALDE